MEGVKKMQITIIGSEYVGVSVGMGFAKMGYEVYFHDVRGKDLSNFTDSLDHVVEKFQRFLHLCPYTNKRQRD